MNKYFAGRMKMADLIATNHNLILFMPRFGIALGFGDKRVEEVCAESGISADFVLLICNVCTFDDYLPELDEIVCTDLTRVVEFLKASHVYYLDKIPHIGEHLSSIASKLGDKYGTILKNFYSDYQTELTAHFRYEEDTVFPYLERLMAGADDRMEQLAGLNDSHENIEETLSDLTQIVYKYLPGSLMPEESIDVVFDILQLSADFEKHYLIEEKIVMPYIQWLERRRG